jgi:hypothetical protein
MDFGFSKGGGNNTNTSAAASGNADSSGTTDLTTGQVANDLNGEPVDDINSISDSADPIKKTTTDTSKTNTGFDNGDGKADDGTPKVPSTGDNTSMGDDNKGDIELATGSVIELGEDKYTVDAAGNIVAADGSIFKEAKDAKAWIASFDAVNDGADDVLSIATIQDALGIEIVGDDEKPIEFENTPAGVKAYVDSVIDTREDDIRQETINTLYQKYPVLPDILNYYVANGNSLEGFGEVQDRSGITIDDSNEAQQESIIRAAFTEQNRKGDVDTYIQYLKSSGILLATAKEELAGLQESDNEAKEAIRIQAEEAEEQRLAKLETYWSDVQGIIKSKTIAGFQIPDTIIVNRNGQKTSATPNDFYNYINNVDKTGKSAYQHDLAKEDAKSAQEDSLLRAYLKFVGGNYSNLVGMAVNKEKVNTLKLQSKNRTGNSVKITKPNTDQANKANSNFGYN